MAEQFAQSTDGFEVESNEPDAQPAVETQTPAPQASAPVSVAAEDDDLVVEEPSAPHGRKPNGQFAKKDGAEPVEEPAEEQPEKVAAKPAEKPQSQKPRDNPQARVEQAIARQREAERRAEAAERRAMELEAARQAAQPEAKAESPKQTWERLKHHPQAPKE